MERGAAARAGGVRRPAAGADVDHVSFVWSTDEGSLFDLPEVPAVPYLNLDDEFADHPKNDRLSHGAFRLQVAGLCWCAKKLTDGHIDQRRVSRLMPDFRATYLQELLDAGVWTEAPDGEGYEVHDYLDWNKSKSWWVAHREREAKRIAAWRAKRAAERRSDADG